MRRWGDTPSNIYAHWLGKYALYSRVFVRSECVVYPEEIHRNLWISSYRLHRLLGFQFQNLIGRVDDFHRIRATVRMVCLSFFVHEVRSVLTSVPVGGKCSLAAYGTHRLTLSTEEFTFRSSSIFSWSNFMAQISKTTAKSPFVSAACQSAPMGASRSRNPKSVLPFVQAFIKKSG